MAFLGLMILAGMAGAIGTVVFVFSLPFLLKSSRRRNRFGPVSSTRSVSAAIGAGFRQTFDFAGRANPMDFWYFAVFVAFLCILSVAATIGLMIAMSAQPTWLSALPLLVIPLLILPSLSMGVRRLHDINRSGLWLGLLLVFGHFILLFWFFQPTQTDDVAVICTFE